MNNSSHRKTALLAGAMAGAAAVAFHSLFIEPTLIEVTEQELPVPGLPTAWEGARVAHLSDLHYGDPGSDGMFRRLLVLLGKLAPDLIVITGDFVVKEPQEVGPCARYMRGVRAPRGVIGVLGDHDFNKRSKQLIPGVVEELTAAGVRLLRNEWIELEGGLRIAGTEPNTKKIDFGNVDLALAGMDGKVPHLLLAHSPDVIGQASRHDVPLVLCGHTHGGQVVVPFFGPPVTHTRVGRQHASGWSSLGTTRMYTSRGFGSHFSLRFWCRPEIALFTLRRA